MLAYLKEQHPDRMILLDVEEPEELLPVYREKLGFSACTVPVFEQYVLAEFLSSGELERYINRRRRKLRQQKG